MNQITKLDEDLRDKQFLAEIRAPHCHWPKCSLVLREHARASDVLEEDHIPEFVNYSKLRGAQSFFQTGHPFPFKMAVSWTVCSFHHSMITNMRIRGEEIPYGKELTDLIDRVNTLAVKLSPLPDTGV